MKSYFKNAKILSAFYNSHGNKPINYDEIIAKGFDPRAPNTAVMNKDTGEKFIQVGLFAYQVNEVDRTITIRMITKTE